MTETNTLTLIQLTFASWGGGRGRAGLSVGGAQARATFIDRPPPKAIGCPRSAFPSSCQPSFASSFHQATQQEYLSLPCCLLQAQPFPFPSLPPPPPHPHSHKAAGHLLVLRGLWLRLLQVSHHHLQPEHTPGRAPAVPQPAWLEGMRRGLATHIQSGDPPPYLGTQCNRTFRTS